MKNLLITSLVIFSSTLSGCGRYLNETYMTGNNSWDYLTPNLDKDKPQCTLYCYRSLAEISCYRNPQVGRENQFVEALGPEGTRDRPCYSQGITTSALSPIK